MSGITNKEQNVVNFQAADLVPSRKYFEQVDEDTSMVKRNIAPDASPPSEPTLSKSFTVYR